MGDLWYVFVVIYFVLLFRKESRQGALIMLLSFFVYNGFVLGVSWEYYYALAATLNLSILSVLSKKYLYAAMCSGVLILVNLYGFVTCYNYGSINYYNDTYVAVLIVQLLLIATKGLLNGISLGGHIESFMVRVHNTVSIKENYVLLGCKKEKGFNK